MKKPGSNRELVAVSSVRRVNDEPREKKIMSHRAGKGKSRRGFDLTPHVARPRKRSRHRRFAFIRGLGQERSKLGKKERHRCGPDTLPATGWSDGARNACRVHIKKEKIKKVTHRQCLGTGPWLRLTDVGHKETKRLGGDPC